MSVGGYLSGEGLQQEAAPRRVRPRPPEDKSDEVLQWVRAGGLSEESHSFLFFYRRVADVL